MKNDEEIMCDTCAFYVNNAYCGLRGYIVAHSCPRSRKLGCSAYRIGKPNGFELAEDGYFSWINNKKEEMKKVDLENEIDSLKKEIKNLKTENAKLSVQLEMAVNDLKNAKMNAEGDKERILSSVGYQIGELISKVIDEKIGEHNDDITAHDNLVRK